MKKAPSSELIEARGYIVVSSDLEVSPVFGNSVAAFRYLCDTTGCEETAYVPEEVVMRNGKKYRIVKVDLTVGVAELVCLDKTLNG